MGQSDSADVKVYDAGDQFFDRYTVVFPDGEMLGIGETGNVPNGFCQHVGNVHDPIYAEGVNLGTPVAVKDCPEPVQRAIRAEFAAYAAMGGMSL